MKKLPFDKIKSLTYSVDLPITNKNLVYRPYNLEDEKVLLAAAMAKDTDPKFYTRNTLDVLSGLVTNDVVLSQLPSVEVSLFMAHLKARSVGEISTIILDNVKYDIDLTQIRIEGIPPKEEFKIDLVNGVGLIMKYPSFEDEIEYQFKFKNNPTDSIYQSILDSVHSIYSGDDVWIVGQDVTKEETQEFLKELTGQSEKLYKFIKNKPYMAVEAYDAEGNPHTITSKEVDFL